VNCIKIISVQFMLIQLQIIPSFNFQDFNSLSIDRQVESRTDCSVYLVEQYFTFNESRDYQSLSCHVQIKYMRVSSYSSI